MISGVLIGVSTLTHLEPRIRGYRRRKGARIDSSQGLCFLHSPWDPCISPWSEVKTSTVSSSTPLSARAITSLPIHSSIAVIWA